MNKEFIPYEQALELKKLGFDENCIAFYEPDNKQVQVVGVEQRYNNPELLRIKDFCAPLYQQAFRWFRDKHGLTSWVQEYTKDTFIYEIRPHVLSHYKEGEIYVYTTYEETEFACLKKLIEIVKKK